METRKDKLVNTAQLEITMEVEQMGMTRCWRVEIITINICTLVEKTDLRYQYKENSSRNRKRGKAPLRLNEKTTPNVP